MGSSPGGVSAHLQNVGDSGRGSDGVQTQPSGASLHVSLPRQSCSSNRRPSAGLVPIPPSLCIPALGPVAQGLEEDQGGMQAGASHCSGLAQEGLVPGPTPALGRGSVETPSSSGSVVTGSVLPPQFLGPEPDLVALEIWLLTSRGFSADVVSTMRQARKPVSAGIYRRVWKTYFAWCRLHGSVPWPFSLPTLLAFLQSGVAKGLALSSIKGQVSALSVLFDKRLALLPEVMTFIQGAGHVAPPYKRPLDPWDLNLVLTILQKPPFEPLKEVSLVRMSQKVAFLVAITSLRRVSELAALSSRSPFLVIHQDKVVLRPVAEFLPKVLSPFHLNQDIVLPSFCPHPVHQYEKALHTLDLVRAIRIYVSRTASFRRSDALFVLTTGHKRGEPASKSSLARWIRAPIQEAYIASGLPVPAGIKAHSTRAVGASWALRHQASALQVCQAATWSSLHTFTKHYQVHAFASADANVGRRILQAAVAHL